MFDLSFDFVFYFPLTYVGTFASLSSAVSLG